MSNNLIIIQAAAPDYRIGFFKALFERRPGRLIYGKDYFTPSVKSAHEVNHLGDVISSKNTYILNRRLLLQTWPCIANDITSKCTSVVELNPRAITSWIFLLKAKFFKKGKTIVWGHLYNRNGEIPFIRKLMITISNGAIFYTESQRKSFGELELSKKISHGAAPNAIVAADEIIPLNVDCKDFIYVGRLVKEKKVHLLVEAFKFAMPMLDPDAKLHIVGAGPELNTLKDIAKQPGLDDSVIFHGHISERKLLQKLYQTSIASISPGYVGLSITQSLSFGKPMIVADKECHSPEIEAMQPGLTGEFFAANDPLDLSKKMQEFHELKSTWLQRSELIAQFCRTNYTYESMAEGFSSLIDEVENG